MFPVIRDGDPVQVRPIRPEDLRCGSILLYRKNGRPVLHRLVRRLAGTGELMLTGDAALQGEDPVVESEIAGIATAVQRASRPIALDTPAQRRVGLLLYRLRPLRRLIWGHQHADTSTS